MAETRRKFEQDFKEGAVRLVRETGKPIAQVARDLGIHDGTLGNWVGGYAARHPCRDAARCSPASRSVRTRPSDLKGRYRGRHGDAPSARRCRAGRSGRP